MPNLSALETKGSPFAQGTTASGFMDAMSGVGPDGLCEHAKTTDVKLVSDILLSQVENLSKTDKNYQSNLEICGGSLEKIRFVRGASYISNMSEIVQKQESELANQSYRLQSKYQLIKSNKLNRAQRP